MMNSYGKQAIFFFAVLFSFKSVLMSAQEYNPWLLSFGINVVDNSGTQFEELLNVSENWDFSKLAKATIEKRFKYDFAIVAALSVNDVTVTNRIDGVLVNEDASYMALDILLKNYVSNYWKDPRHAKNDQYIIAGWGGNFIDWILNNSVNFGFGMNLRIGTYTWIDFQTIGKFSIDNKMLSNANHLQHSISVMFWL